MHAVHGFSKNPLSTADKTVCWTSDAGDEMMRSGLPSRGSVAYWAVRRTRTAALEDARLEARRTNRTSPLPRFIVADASGAVRDNGTTNVSVWGAVWAESMVRPRLLRLAPEASRRWVANERCPGECSGRGLCYVTRDKADARTGGRPVAAASAAFAARCACHAGFSGRACETTNQSVCMHGCSGRGECIARMCRCEPGRWGLDCSLSDEMGAPPHGVNGRRLPPFSAPTYILPLPTEWSLQHLYQGSRAAERGMYEANRLFLERLHRHAHLVSRPEGAALFYVPVLFAQMHGCLWESQRYLNALVDFLRATPPFAYYWRRRGGADHVFFTTQDMGGCFLSPAVMASSIVVSHFGFTGGIRAPHNRAPRHP